MAELDRMRLANFAKRERDRLHRIDARWLEIDNNPDLVVAYLRCLSRRWMRLWILNCLAQIAGILRGFTRPDIDTDEVPGAALRTRGEYVLEAAPPPQIGLLSVITPVGPPAPLLTA
jgi:hypothetical protein